MEVAALISVDSFSLFMPNCCGCICDSKASNSSHSRWFQVDLHDLQLK